MKDKRQWTKDKGLQDVKILRLQDIKILGQRT